MFDKHANLKYKYGNRHFGAEGYSVSTVGLNEATIRKYKKTKKKHDTALDQLSVREYEGPFKGAGNTNALSGTAKVTKAIGLNKSESQRL